MQTHALHVHWTDGTLALWAEAAVSLQSGDQGLAASAVSGPASGAVETGNVAVAVLKPHPAALDSAGVGEMIASALGGQFAFESGAMRLLLPTRQGKPIISPGLARAAAVVEQSVADDFARADDGDAQSGIETAGVDEGEPVVLAAYTVQTVVFKPEDAVAVLESLEAAFEPAENEMERDPEAGMGAASAGRTTIDKVAVVGPSLRYFMTAARFVRWLLSQQRFVPALMQDYKGSLRGLWQPWIADVATVERLAKLVSAMPPAARAVDDSYRHEAWPILDDFLIRVCDAQCRTVLTGENLQETIEGRKPGEDSHVAWLTGLLRTDNAVTAQSEQRPDLLKRVRNWVGGLDERGTSSAWRLFMRLDEPIDLGGLAELEAPGPGLTWALNFGLQSCEDSTIFIDAPDLWLLPTGGATVAGKRMDSPQELLLKELGRATRVYKTIEKALDESEPSQLKLTTTQAYDFLREHRTPLAEQGFCVIVPDWWDSPNTRLGVRLAIDSGPGDAAGGMPGVSGPRVGLGSLVNYTWQISIGQTSLSLEEFEKLANMRSPLVMIGGRWVEVRPEDVQAAIAFIRENPGGQMELGKAIRLAYAADMRTTGLPVVGLDVSGWLASVFGSGDDKVTMPMLSAPANFVGSLRPYQAKGLSWLSFLDRCGLGSCLADDMGLGKTIQLLAMLLHERNAIDATGATERTVGPTLLIVPMSVVGNWVREGKRFAPSLRVMVHHGHDRQTGQPLADTAMQHDLVVTTYSLAHRDRESLELVPWWRVALDEAQNIKNPAAKQTQAIRSLEASRRIALTGTPIENRLSELWSIMDFLNPGLLGTVHDFRTRFALPIEKYHDPQKSKRLRGLVQPFILRRLKTDPNVIADLPEKVESKEYCYLTPEQASLYETTVKQMLAAAEHSDGIQRRGVILAGLVKLKQICNHPLQFLKERDAEGLAAGNAGSGKFVSPSRSGKCVRLIQMLEEVVASGGQALVFTQFRQMGDILVPMLRKHLDRDVLFLHGGSTLKEREHMVACFQKADGKTPIFILSLKAGGVGLNLTAANHVFHFDRWWNPAVESQATDRAFRIGQTRTVQVHKFVVSGTLEERIDQMIEAKTELADNVIGSGENWLTELSLSQLRDVLALRPDAVAGADDDSEMGAEG